MKVKRPQTQLSATFQKENNGFAFRPCGRFTRTQEIKLGGRFGANFVHGFMRRTCLGNQFLYVGLALSKPTVAFLMLSVTHMKREGRTFLDWPIFEQFGIPLYGTCTSRLGIHISSKEAPKGPPCTLQISPKPVSKQPSHPTHPTHPTRAAFPPALHDLVPPAPHVPSPSWAYCSRWTRTKAPVDPPSWADGGRRSWVPKKRRGRGEGGGRGGGREGRGEGGEGGCLKGELLRALRCWVLTLLAFQSREPGISGGQKGPTHVSSCNNLALVQTNGSEVVKLSMLQVESKAPPQTKQGKAGQQVATPPNNLTQNPRTDCRQADKPGLIEESVYCVCVCVCV